MPLKTLDSMDSRIWISAVIGTGLGLESEPLLIAGLGIPLPYILVESLPLFDHLTLLYRLSWVPIVCDGGFAVQHWTSRRYWSYQ